MTSSALYDPNTDTWAPAASLGQARCAHAAASTGSKVYAFGGLTDCGNGAAIGPGLEVFDGATWSVVSAGGAPGGRYNIPALWTGTSLFIYGGNDNVSPALATGGVFTPATATWANADCALSGCERGGFFATFLDGNLVRLFGGDGFGSAPAGLQYDLGANSWSAWATPANTPVLPESYADDGRRMFFLGAKVGSCGDVQVLIYDRSTSSWLPTDTAQAPAGLLSAAAAAWVGSELIAWAGSCGAAPSTVGARYQPPAPP